MENAAVAPDEMGEAEDRLPTTKAEFMAWSPDDDFQYEWDAGTLIQTAGMKKEERYLVWNIQMAFRATTAFSRESILLEEAQCWVTDEQMRIPDVAFFTKEQIKASALTDQEPIPAFVVELISPGDKATHVEKKVLEYFAAGVQVVWHIYPDLKMVRVFTSPKHCLTCFEGDTFDAAPAVADLQLTVDALFIR